MDDTFSLFWCMACILPHTVPSPAHLYTTYLPVSPTFPPPPPLPSADWAVCGWTPSILPFLPPVPPIHVRLPCLCLPSLITICCGSCYVPFSFVLRHSVASSAIHACSVLTHAHLPAFHYVHSAMYLGINLLDLLFWPPSPCIPTTIVPLPPTAYHAPPAMPAPGPCLPLPHLSHSPAITIKRGRRPWRDADN